MVALTTVRPLLDPACGQADDCTGCEARIVGLCAPMGHGPLEELAASSDRVVFSPRDPLFHQGDPARHVFILREGAARVLRLLPDGRQAAMGLRFGGDVLGFTTASEHGLGAEALSGAVACRIDRRSFDGLLRRHPDLERHFLDLCARELAETQDHLVALGRFTAEERVAAFLVSFVHARELRGFGGPVFELPTTRADMGELLGLTLETVSRTMSAFRRRGWLRLHGAHGVELVGRKALESLAEGNGTD